MSWCDVDAEIGTSLRDGAAFYTLVDRPESGAVLDRNKFRKIDIAFDNPDYNAVTRLGYYPPRGPGRVSSADAATNGLATCTGPTAGVVTLTATLPAGAAALGTNSEPLTATAQLTCK